MKGTRFHRNSRAGFSLVEVLIVTAVLGLLAALIFTASGPARKMAQVTACTSNLRQIGLAFSMYLSDYSQYPDPNTIMGKAAPGYLKDRRVLYCPADTEGPLMDQYSYRPRVFVPLDPPDAVALSTLRTVDPNTSLVWCGVHVREKETPLNDGAEGMRRVPSEYPNYLVLRADGRVERVHRDRVRQIEYNTPLGSYLTFAFPGDPWYDRAHRVIRPHGP